MRSRELLLRALVLGGVALCANLAGTATAAPPEGDPGVGLAVTAGADGWYQPGSHVTVEVRISVDQVLTGHVDIVDPSGSIVRRAVDVAGGTTKSYLLVVPTSPGDQPLDVRAYRGDAVVAREEVTLKHDDTVELVGVLPAAQTRTGELPDPVAMDGSVGRAVIAALPNEIVGMGAAALEAYDTIAATSADLRSLGESGRGALFDWLNLGGVLLLDDAGDLTSLPAEWRPEVSGYSFAGQGEIRLVPGQITAGKWAGIVPPTATASVFTGAFGGAVETAASPTDDLARRAGFHLPRLTPLLVILAAYALAVSALMYLGLRAIRRLPLAWVAIPATALAVSIGVLLAGGLFRSSSHPSAASYVELRPGGASEVTALLAFSRDGGRSTTALPPGWTFADASATLGSTGADTQRIDLTADSADLAFTLRPGQVATADITGPARAQRGLAITASVDGDRVVGTVTNDGTGDLQAVAVFGPGGSQFVGDLPAGRSAPFDLRAATLGMTTNRAQQVWSSQSTARGGPVEFGIWSLASGSRTMYPPAMVRAAGWSSERPSAVDVPAGTDQRTVVSATAPITPGPGPTPAAAIRSSVARSPFTGGGKGLGDLVVRYVLPPGPVTTLELALPNGLTDVELWTGAGWAKGQRTGQIVSVPGSAVRQGVVLMRVTSQAQMYLERAPELRGVGS